MDCSWDSLVDQGLQRLDSLKLLGPLRAISLLPKESLSNPNNYALKPDEFETFDGLGPWDRTMVEIKIADSTYKKWINGDDVRYKPDSVDSEVGADNPHEFKKLTLFSTNDYLGLSSHPTVRKAVAKAALEYGMGPRGSALSGGYTDYHRRLESSLAELKQKEECLLCPTGFAANLAVMTAIGSISSLLAGGRKPIREERVAVFSDFLNHASIIDGIRLGERQQEVELFVYKHLDMTHLDSLLSTCPMKKKVVVTDSVFSMDGDVAPTVELVELRKKHSFLLVIDDAHGTLVFGKHGGGLADEHNCEKGVDICVGTLSKAIGNQGGFIACSKKWKQFILSRGRSFVFSTAIPVPVAAGAHAAIMVAKAEKWRRTAIWDRVRDLSSLIQVPIITPIVSLVVGSEENAHRASRHLLNSGFHVSAVAPPVVPPNSCRLRISLSSAHTRNDIEKLASALSLFIKPSNANDKSNGSISAKL